MLLPLFLKGQDLHYTQFYHSPLNINPGLTGIFDGDARFSGHFRRQWKNVPVDYLTFTGSVDGKIYPKKTGSNFFGAGLHINYDRAGFSKLQLAEVALSGSYSIVVSPSFIITPGVQFGFSQRSYKENDLFVDAQFDGFLGKFDPTFPTNESFDNLNAIFVNFNAGLNFRLQKHSRTNVDFGAGVFHLNKPNQQFFSDLDYKLPIRLAGYAQGSLKLMEPLDLVARAAGQFQNEFREYVGSLGVRFHINQQRGKQLNLLLGANVRFNQFADAVAPTIELEFNTLKVAASYDLNLSEFRDATETRGGPEIALIYRIVKVKPLKVYKTCPIY